MESLVHLSPYALKGLGFLIEEPFVMGFLFAILIIWGCLFRPARRSKEEVPPAEGKS